MATNITENEIREVLSTLESFKSSGITATRIDPVLSTGKNVTLTQEDRSSEWMLK
jgi:hypothetical protein